MHMKTPFIIGLLLLPLGCGYESTGPDHASLDVSPTTATLTAIGDTVRFTAVSRNSEGRANRAGIAWSSDTLVATVEHLFVQGRSQVMATAVGNGTTIIRALIPSGLFNCVGACEASATLTVAIP